MYRSLLMPVLAISMVPASVHEREVDSMIELRARCDNGSICHFTGNTVSLELELFNAGNEAVALPIEYYRRRGPKVVLVDNHSGKEKKLRMGPPIVHLVDQMQVLEPGDSVRIPWSVPDHHINTFALRPVDVTAIFSFTINPRIAMVGAPSFEAKLRVLDARMEASGL